MKTVPEIYKRNQNGFSLIEIISVLVIMGILVAVAASRATNHDVEVYTGADALKTHLRYAQTMAMNKDPNTSGNETIMGINYDAAANKYWLFKGTTTSDILYLPDDSKFITSNNKIDLAAKKIKFGQGFTIYFDSHGIPYTAYSSSPLAKGTNELTISVTSLSGGSSTRTVTLTPRTGFIP